MSQQFVQAFLRTGNPDTVVAGCPPERGHRIARQIIGATLEQMPAGSQARHALSQTAAAVQSPGAYVAQHACFMNLECYRSVA